VMHEQPGADQRERERERERDRQTEREFVRNYLVPGLGTAPQRGSRV
jgi:hypothetical protein